MPSPLARLTRRPCALARSLRYAFLVFRVRQARAKEFAEFREIASAKREKKGGRTRRRAAPRRSLVARGSTKQNYRLRAQHHHKSQVYGYVGRIRA